MDVGAGVAQAPREETAGIWRSGWSRVNRYGDLTGGAVVVIGDDKEPRAGDVAGMVKAAAKGSESVPRHGQGNLPISRKTKPSAIST